MFTNRADKLHELESAMADKVNIGIYGLTGIGKTTFIQQFFWLHKDRLYELIWLRVDDLFGRNPDGLLRIGALRWNKETLLKRLIEIQKERPRAVLIFDNVQAAPLDVRWLADKLGYTQAIYLSWDAEALPLCDTVLHLDPLPLPAASNTDIQLL